MSGGFIPSPVPEPSKVFSVVGRKQQPKGERFTCPITFKLPRHRVPRPIIPL
jgi:hypothetical protein